MALRSLLLSINDDTANPYGLLKQKLTSTYGKTRWQQAFTLLDHPDLGDRAPWP